MIVFKRMKYLEKLHTENNIIEKSSKDERHLMFMEWKTIVKIATLGKLIYRLNIIPIKIPTFLKELILQIMEWKGP